MNKKPQIIINEKGEFTPTTLYIDYLKLFIKPPKYKEAIQESSWFFQSKEQIIYKVVGICEDSKFKTIHVTKTNTNNNEKDLIECHYDANDNLFKYLIVFDDLSMEIYYYKYNELNNIIEINIETRKSIGTVFKTYVFDYEYDDNGNITKVIKYLGVDKSIILDTCYCEYNNTGVLLSTEIKDEHGFNTCHTLFYNDNNILVGYKQGMPRCDETIVGLYWEILENNNTNFVTKSERDDYFSIIKEYDDQHRIINYKLIFSSVMYGDSVSTYNKLSFIY